MQIGGTGVLGSGAYAGNIALSNSSILAYSSNAGQTFSGIISGTGSLTQSAGVLAFTASNTYNGGTAVNGGILSVTANNNLGKSSGILGFAGGTLLNGGTGTTNFTTARSITLNTGGGTLDTGAAGNSSVFSGNVTNNANLLTLQGSGNGTYSGSIGINDAGGGLTKAGIGPLGRFPARIPTTAPRRSMAAR